MRGAKLTCPIIASITTTLARVSLVRPALYLLFFLPFIFSCVELTSTNQSTFFVSAGDCVNFTDLNITVIAAPINSTTYWANSTNFIGGGVIQCLGNATIVNQTVVQNITINQSCPATSATLWANSTSTINNASITCLGNAVVNQTIEQNITINQSCPATSTTLWANSTSTVNNATITCLGNAVVNQTVVQNITINQSCPATTAFLWANSTSTVNNATITCAGNATVLNTTTIENVSVNGCNLTMNITPTSLPQLYFNASTNSTIFVSPVPFDWCFENRNESYNATTFVRSEKANNSFYFNVPACSVIQTCPICAAGNYSLAAGENKSFDNLSFACAAPVICPNLTTMIGTAWNETGKTDVLVSVASLLSQDETQAALERDGDKLISIKLNASNTQLEAIKNTAYGPGGLSTQLQDATAQLKGWETGQKSNSGIYLALAAGGAVCVVFLVWRKSSLPYFSGLPRQPNPDKMKEAVEHFDKAAEVD